LYESQQRRRSEADFMADAGAILVSSLEYRATLTRLAERAVPPLADWCAFYLQTDEGPLEEVASAARAGADRARLAHVARAQAGESEDAVSIDRVVRTGVAALVSNWREGASCAAERKEAARQVGLTSLIIVPLVAHGRTIGALALGSLTDEHLFAAADLRFAQDLAYRSALSIDNTLSYEEARKANRLKDEFLANLSHELRTPLNAIVGYAQMLRMGAMPEERRARAFEVLHKNASALMQIVEDVLDISRIVTGKIQLQLRPVRVAPIVRHSIETVQPGAEVKGIQITFDPTNDGLMVAGDSDRLQQVFWNLLSNAVKFTPRNGRVDVRLARIEETIEVLVIDNGVGIDPTFLPHAFERFRQADSAFGRPHGGLGLGLAIVRQIVEMHGGTISADSAGIGKGATFRVVLPAHPQAGRYTGGSPDPTT
jgi:signal transduction histidine kinase